MSNPAVIAVSGVKNSGKTTFLEKLVAELTARGWKVAVIKHDGHSFLPDIPGTDTDRFWKAGAVGTAIYDGEKFKITRRESVLASDLLSQFSFADLILLEGEKYSSYPKFELVRSGNSKVPVCDPATLLALVTDLPLKCPEGAKLLDLNDTLGAAELIEEKVLKG